MVPVSRNATYLIAISEGNLSRMSDQEQEIEQQVISEADRDMTEARNWTCCAQASRDSKAKL